MPNYTIGLDLGQQRDYSALVIAERVHVIEGRSSEDCFERDAGRHVMNSYHLRHIQRFELGTPYTSVVDAVGELLRSPELLGHAVLLFDRTGVGGAVADLFTQAYMRGHLGAEWPLGVTLTAGFSKRGGIVGHGAGAVHKHDVVQRLYMLLEAGRIKIPLGLPLAEQLTKEIRAFRFKQNAQTGNLSFEAERESDHDDLVIALALAVWYPHTSGEPRYLDSESGELREKPEGTRIHADAP